MEPTEPIPSLLREIAELLRVESHDRQAEDIEALERLATSKDSEEQKRFRHTITEEKWYWLGMGTIADIVFSDPELDRRFKKAYVDLAEACEDVGLDSIYSKDVGDIFGKWMKGEAV